MAGGLLAQSFSFIEAQGHLATIEGNYRKLDGGPNATGAASGSESREEDE